MYAFLTSSMSARLSLVLRIREVSGWNLDPKIGYSDRVHKIGHDAVTSQYAIHKSTLRKLGGWKTRPLLN
jgi:hypothetical protein